MFVPARLTQARLAASLIEDTVTSEAIVDVPICISRISPAAMVIPPPPLRRVLPGLRAGSRARPIIKNIDCQRHGSILVVIDVDIERPREGARIDAQLGARSGIQPPIIGVSIDLADIGGPVPLTRQLREGGTGARCGLFEIKITGASKGEGNIADVNGGGTRRCDGLCVRRAGDMLEDMTAADMGNGIAIIRCSRVHRANGIRTYWKRGGNLHAVGGARSGLINPHFTNDIGARRDSPRDSREHRSSVIINCM